MGYHKGIRVAAVLEGGGINQAQVSGIFAGVEQVVPVIFCVFIWLAICLAWVGLADELVMDAAEVDAGSIAKFAPQVGEPVRLLHLARRSAVKWIVGRGQGDEVGDAQTLVPGQLFEGCVIDSRHGQAPFYSSPV